MVEFPEIITRAQVDAAILALGLDTSAMTITAIHIGPHHIDIEQIEVKGRQVLRISTQVDIVKEG